MKICRVEIFPIRHPIQIRADYSWGSYTYDESVVVRVTSDEGVTGVGSCGGLRPHFSGESVDGAISNIKRIAQEYLLGENPFDIERIMTHIDEMLLGNNCTKSTIDCALYDLKGKALGVPVYELLGGKCRDKAKLHWVVCSAADNDTIVEEACSAVNAGYKEVKVRGFGNVKEDVERFMAVRKAVGPDVGIAIDCNGAYQDVKTAMEALSVMADNGLVCAEEPLARNNIKGLKYLKDNLRTMISVDESGWGLEEIVNLIRADAVDAVELVPCRIGGLTKAMKVRNICDAFGLERTLTQYGQNGICNAATAHLIAASPAPESKIEELGGYLNYHAKKGFFDTEHVIDDIIVKPSVTIENGVLFIPDTPGLGVELDEENLERFQMPGYASVVVE